MTDPPLQLVHLHSSKMTMTLVSDNPERWGHTQHTCCGKNVRDLSIFKVVYWGFDNVTCEECLSGYALEKLAEVP